MNTLRNVIVNFRIYGIRIDNEQGRRNFLALHVWALAVPFLMAAMPSVMSGEPASTGSLLSFAASVLATWKLIGIIEGQLKEPPPSGRMRSAWQIQQDWRCTPGIRLERVL